MAVVRILANGGLDPSFGVAGVAMPIFLSSARPRRTPLRWTPPVGSSSREPSRRRAIPRSASRSCSRTARPTSPWGMGARRSSRALPGHGGTRGARPTEWPDRPRGNHRQQRPAGRSCEGWPGGRSTCRLAGDGFWGDSLEGMGDPIRCVALDASGRLLTGGLRTAPTSGKCADSTRDGSEDFFVWSRGFAIVRQWGQLRHPRSGEDRGAARGSILTIGTGGTAPSSSSDAARLTSTGALDTGFDGDGKAQWPRPAGCASRSGLAVHADGRYLVAGSAEGGDVVVARFLANGTIDPAFGVSGAVVAKLFGTASESGTGVRLDSAGRIVVCGEANGSWAWPDCRATRRP